MVHVEVCVAAAGRSVVPTCIGALLDGGVAAAALRGSPRCRMASTTKQYPRQRPMRPAAEVRQRGSPATSDVFVTMGGRRQ